MKKSIKNIVALTGATALLALAGCASDGAGSSGGSGSLSDYDLSGIDVAVGSKTSTSN